MQQQQWALPKAIAKWATTVQAAGLPHDSDHALRELQDILLQHHVAAHSDERQEMYGEFEAAFGDLRINET